MASPGPKPVNINRADETELKTLPQIGKFRAQAIIHACTKQGGRLMEDDFKSIPKLGAEVWQPLLDGKAITFGSPAPTTRHEPKSVSSNISMEDTKTKASPPLTLQLGLPPNQLLSTLPRPAFSLNPITKKPNPLLYNPQPVVTIRHQGTLLKGVWIRPSHKKQWQLKLLSLGNNSSLSRKLWRMFGTSMVLRYGYSRVNWRPSKKTSPRLRG